MSTHVEEQTVTVPAQAGPRETPVETVIDHVSAHSARCYWDHREARWVCRGA
jgi:hypothetical protein